MTKINLLKKSRVVGIVVIFLCSSFILNIGGYSEEIGKVDSEVNRVVETEENVLVSCRTYGLPDKFSKEIEIPYAKATRLLEKIKKLAEEIAYDPLSAETKKLQEDIILYSKKNNLITKDIPLESLQSHLFTPIDLKHPKKGILPIVGNRGTASFCNFATTGEGSQFPIIILPRLIPILLTPIPRAFLHWSANEGFTTCGSLLTGTGFIARGMQRGTALGFWGIGFSVFLPPFRAYGFVGYALFATCTAEEMEPWPPNYAPEVSAVSPIDGAENVAISTSELSFQISDENGDKMDYTVTTDPDIGSGSENKKPDGTYSISISDLEGTTKYTWYVQVTDGLETTNASYSFTTEAVAPIVTDSSPPDDARNVPISLAQLSFDLKDPQGDLMDYTVETSPDIGSGSGINVDEGTYAIDINNVDYLTEYKWFVNVTDGRFWKHRVFSFKTRPIPGPWWNDDWSYRKEIIVNYEKVDGILDNFPILIKLESDSDLVTKAQNDGDDIVFTDYSGLKLHHEIELYGNQSGGLLAWVNVQNLNPDSILYMYYGNPNCSNQQNVAGTWDYNFVMVQHMSGSSATECIDSSGTGNNVDGDQGNPQYHYVGKIGYCIDFDDTDYLNIPDDNTFDVESVTLETWLHHDDVSTQLPIAKMENFVGAYTMYLVDGLAVGMQTWISDNYNRVEGNISTGTNDWRYCVCTYDNSNMKVYLDGVLDCSPTSITGNIDATGNPVRIGWGCTDSYGYDGRLDEVRISNIGRSSAWISTSYNTMNDPSSFLSFGPEETES